MPKQWLQCLVLVLGLSSSACGGGREGGSGGGGGIDPECTESADTCAGERICVAQVCEAAFSRFYRLEIDQVQFPLMKPSSTDCWDAACGAPDPLAIIRVNGREVGRTTAVQDRFTASWSAGFDVQLVAGSSLGIEVYDEDLTSNDVGVLCSAEPIAVDLLRGRGFGCNQNDTTRVQVAVSIVPK